MKYRKKPVVVEAYKTDKEIVIHTLEGDMKASIGDYIITGISGEQYPCKPDVFKKTYEVVKSPEKMTNYEYIRNMSIDEMATAIANGLSSDICDYCNYDENICTGFPCWQKEDSEIVAEWLKRSRDNA